MVFFSKFQKPLSVKRICNCATCPGPTMKTAKKNIRNLLEIFEINDFRSFFITSCRSSLLISYCCPQCLCTISAADSVFSHLVIMHNFYDNHIVSSNFHEPQKNYLGGFRHLQMLNKTKWVFVRIFRIILVENNHFVWKTYMTHVHQFSLTKFLHDVGLLWSTSRCLPNEIRLPHSCDFVMCKAW